MDRLRSLADGKQTITLLTEFNHATLEAIASVCLVGAMRVFFCQLSENFSTLQNLNLFYPELDFKSYK